MSASATGVISVTSATNVINVTATVTVTATGSAMSATAMAAGTVPVLPTHMKPIAKRLKRSGSDNIENPA